MNLREVALGLEFQQVVVFGLAMALGMLVPPQHMGAGSLEWMAACLALLGACRWRRWTGTGAQGALRSAGRVLSGVVILGLPLWCAGWSLGLMPWHPWALILGLGLLIESGKPWRSRVTAQPRSGLSARQQVAILLMSLPPEVSAQLFKELGPEEVQAITLEISKLPQIAPEVRKELQAWFLALLRRQGIGRGLELEAAARRHPVQLASILQEAANVRPLEPQGLPWAVPFSWLSGKSFSGQSLEAVAPGLALGLLFAALEGPRWMGSLALGLVLGSAGAWRVGRTRRALMVPREAGKANLAPPTPAPPEPHKVSPWLDLRLGPMEMRTGPGLFQKLGDPEGPLSQRVSMARRHLARELGFILPGILVVPDPDLKGREMVVTVRGREAGRVELRLQGLLAIAPEEKLSTLRGDPTVDPTYGMPAVWIPSSGRAQAERLGCMVFDAVSVAAILLTELSRRHAAELLDLQAVQDLLDRQPPALVRSVLPHLALIDLTHLLRNLLREGVSIRNLALILETLADQARYTQDLEALTEEVRAALAPELCLALGGPEGFRISSLDVRGSESDQELLESAARLAREMTDEGLVPIVVTSEALRARLHRLTYPSQPGLTVLSWRELACREVLEERAGRFFCRVSPIAA